jgi:serine/threonine protein kinase
MVLQYAEGRNFNYWMNNNSKYFNWFIKVKVLNNIINGLKEIHQKQMVHRDFHVGNILFKEIHLFTSNYISDMGLCGEIGNIDETNIYGVMPYVAPEVLRGNPYTPAADVYSFSMIMYFVATGRQPFANCAHDHHLALDICKGIRPEINEPEAPKCYIELMEKCWNSNPVNRPNAAEIEATIISFYNSYRSQDNDEIKRQFQEAENYRNTNNNSKSTIHPQAIYTSRLLNPYTKDLPEYIDENTQYLRYVDNNTECLDCAI